MRFPILLLTLASMLCPVVAADADLPHVAVYGTATTQVQPDLLRWRLSVDRVGAEVAEVADAHAADVAAVLDFLKQQGIPAKEIQTAHMQLSEHREFRNQSWIKEGYEASTAVSFTSKDLGQYRTLWLGLSRLKGMSVKAAVWDSSRRIPVQNETREEALKAAKEKATNMAATLGMKLAEPLAIVEIPVQSDSSSTHGVYGNRLNVESRDDDDEGDSMVAPGSIEVRIRVYVTFRIVAR
ncbi:MAG: SIMPL domain-containing protein [Opitutaceae bacterium]|nr:SIMPL domain-containing protein [Opitutaceae bacterium]